MARETWLPQDLQNLAPSFNVSPQCWHLSAICTGPGTERTSGAAHCEQNFAPTRMLVPQAGQTLARPVVWSDVGTGLPQLRQNFPVTSVLHLGHFIIALRT